MNAILAILVSIAMMLSPTGVLPAQPETQSSWTISNLTVSRDDTSVTLPQEARISLAAGEEKIAAHFELGSGEEILLPLSGEISQEGVRFSMGGSNSYSIPAETLMEKMNLDEESLPMLEACAAVFKEYALLMNAAMRDTDFMFEYDSVVLQTLIDTCGGEITQGEEEVESRMMPVQKVQLNMNGENTIALLDGLMACGLAEVENLFKATLNLANLIEGSQYTSFGELAAAAGMTEEEGMVMDLTFADTDELYYQKIEMDMDQYGVNTQVQSEAYIDRETAACVMQMRSGDDTYGYEMNGAYEINGPLSAPEDFVVAYDFHVTNDYSFDDEAEGETFHSSDDHVFTMYASGGFDEGLLSSEAGVTVESTYVNGYSGDMSEETQVIMLGLTYGEALEEDGSVTGSVQLSLDDMESGTQVSFDLKRAAAAYADYFADTENHVLSFAEDDPANNLMMIDVMQLTSQAMLLSCDENVIAMGQLLEEIFYTEEYEDYSEEEYEDYSEEEYEDYSEEEYIEEYESANFESLEAAAELYGGVIPAFTAPEGFEMIDCFADESMVIATYASEEEEFSFTLYNYAYELPETDYYSMVGGELTPVEGVRVEIASYDGEAASATIFAPTMEVYFSFMNMDNEQALAVVQGMDVQAE